MPEKFKKKKLTPRRMHFLTAILARLLRMMLRLLIAYGYTVIFNKLGLSIGFWMKLLCLVTSYWISSQVVHWALCKMNAVLFPDDLETMVEDEGIEKYSSDLRGLFDDLKQLIFYTTDK